MGMIYFFSFTFLILLLRLDFCRLSDAGDYMTEAKNECHFVNGTEKVRYLQRLFYNQEEFVYFDSDVGHYIAKTELGRPDADGWNNNPDYIAEKRSSVERYCIYNYGIYEGAGIIGRKAQPEVVVSRMPHDDPHGALHMIVCNVYGFYPPEIEVKWYRNGQEETEQVQSSELLQDGDWTFRILVMLETEINNGDTFSCEVHHKSLEDPKRVDWKPQISDADRSKMATGIGGFVLGAVFIIVGLVIYFRGKKGQTSFRGPQSENFLPVA